MDGILKHSNLSDYQKSRTWINWCRINGTKFQSLSTCFPLINNILGSQRISITDSHADSSSISFGNTPHHLLKMGFQKINQNNTIIDVSDYSNLTSDECVEYLNLLKIFIPFDKLTAERTLNNKFFNQRISAKSVLSEDIQRYTDKIQIIAVFEDLLKPAKEFPMNRIIHLLSQVYSTQESSDMTKQINNISDYDLSNIAVLTDKNLVVQDQSAQKILFSYVDNFNEYLSDFTNLFQNKTINLAQDSTFINHRIDGSSIIKYVDSSIDNYSYTIGSPIDQSFIYLKEVLTGDISENIISYAIPIQYQLVLPNQVPQFFHTVRDGYNDQLGAQFSIPYGTYVHDVLKYYYGFNDNLILLILKLILAQVLRNANENLVLDEINGILQDIIGISNYEGEYSTWIKDLEYQISIVAQDMTGISQSVIYHTDFIDVTTNVIMSYSQSMDDIYSIINQLNTVRFIHVFDFGYEGELNMNSSSVIMSRDRFFTSSGYLNIFTSVNEISL